MSRKFWQRFFAVLLITGWVLGLVSPVAAAPASQTKTPGTVEVEAELLKQIEANPRTGYLIYFRDHPDLSAAQKMSWEERGWYVMNTLKATAEKSQAKVRAYLDAQGADYEAFWIDNIISVKQPGNAAINTLMTFPEIESLKAHRTLGIIEPEIVALPDEAVNAIEPNISHVGAPDAWALGINGAGVVVASIDTGVRYTHQALVNHYRGNLGGGNFNHNYNWWDPYGDHPTSPADDNGHGSHTMGTMIGDDGGANQIGMAPGAKWMACRGCNTSTCSDTALLSCAQFMAAPTDLTGANTNPTMRPNAVNNSWGDCAQSYDSWYQGVVDAWHAAGIYPVFSNGNASNCGYTEPPGLNTVGNPARYGNVTGVGSSGQSNGQYAPHSNWGPTDNPDTVNPRGYPYLKPQVIAPGVNIRSSVNTGDAAYEGGWSGTSMSAPHVTGLVALMWQAGPCLVGDYAATETMIEQTATPVPYATGGNPPPGPGNVPNYATGWGEINALAAVQAALSYCGDSTLTGQVTQAAKLEAPGDPISGAVIAATNLSGTFQTLSNAQGYYTLTLWADTYDVAVSAFGYQLWTATGVVVTGTTTLNPQLTLANWYTVTGVVTDANTGWPLYAKITIGGYPGDPIWTDPATGAYSISLPEDITYTFDVQAYYPGYLPASATVGPLTGAVVQNFALDVDGLACNAPGYSLLGGLSEDFEGVTPPALPTGWAVVDVSGTAGDWFTHAGTRHPSGQPAHGGANLVLFNSYSASSGSSTRLYRTAGVDMTTLTSTDLSFWMYHDTGYAGSNDRVQVQVSTNGGTSWVDVGAPVSRYNGTTGWAQHTVSLADYAAETNLMLGFLGISAYGNDVHLDDIVLSPSCVAPSGGLLIGNVYDAQTLAALNGATVQNDAGDSTTTAATPADPAVDDGFYYLYSEIGATRVFTASYPLYGVVTATVAISGGETAVHDFYLPTGQLTASPSPLEVLVSMGMSTTVPLTLTNLGGAAVNWEVREKDLGFVPVLEAGESVLVVRKDTIAADAMQAALTANGITFLGVTDAAFQAMTVADLLNYEAVFYAGTPGFSGAPSASETKLIEYLDAGGKLYISDNDLGYYRHGSTFYDNYLQATYVADNGGELLTGEDLMAGLDLDVTEDPYPDSFTVGAEGTRIFAWNPGGNAGGVALDRNGYQAIYTSFDFQQITDAADENELVLRVMDFLVAGDVPWLSSSPITGTLAGYGDQVISVTLDASIPEITQPGEYLAELQFKNDTPYGKLIVPVTMTVQAPADWGKLDGTVTGLGYCDVNPHPLEDAQVFVEASNGMTWTLVTGPDGYYSIWLQDTYAPITLTVTAAQHESGLATGVVVTPQMTTTVDFDLRWLMPCVSVDPDALHASVPFGQQVTKTLTITNSGAAALNVELQENDQGYAPLKGESYPPMAARSTDISDFNPNFVAGEGNILDLLAAKGWGSGAAMPGSGRYRAGSACNEDCTQLWVFGGGAGATGSDTVMYYDTATDTWTSTGLTPIPNAAQNWQAVFIDGKFYLPGGYNGAHNNWLQIYDPATNTWTAGANMPVATTPMAAGWNGKLYIFGGNPGPMNNVAMYDPATNTWTTGLAPMPTARSYGRALTVGDKIFVIGGATSSATTGAVEVYDPAANTWTTLPSLGTARADASVFWVGDYVYASGGITSFTTWAGITVVERYYLPNFPGGSWEVMTPAPTAFGAAAYGCAADKMWSIGGQDASATATTLNRYHDEGLPCHCGGGDVPWLSESPITATVPADGGSAVVDVVFDASVPEVNLPGNYYATLRVKSNDPVYGGLTLPVTMTVLAPPDYAILFGTVTGLGYCDLNPEPLEGLDVIIEGITHTYTATTNANGEYIYWLPESEGPVNLSVDGAALNYSFAMAGPVPITAQVTSTVDFDLRWLMPCVSATPQSLEVTIAQGYSQTAMLVLANDGAAALDWELRDIDTTGSPKAGTIEVLLLTPDDAAGGDISLLQNTLATFPDLNVTLWTGGDPTGAALAPYDVVIVGNDYLWTAGGMTAAGVGDALADYIDLGGKVIDTEFVQSYDQWALAGRYITDGYSCFTPATQDFDTPPYSMGTVYDLNHPIMAGVTTVVDDPTIGYAHQDVGLAPGATRLADWNDGQIFVAFNDNVVGVNQMWYHGSNWSGDMPTLMHNAIVWLAGGGAKDAPWLSEVPISGTLGADSVFDVGLVFDTMTYTVGTYTAILEVNSNDPLNATVEIPVTMTIVAPLYGVDVSNDMSAWGLPDTLVTYTVYVTNTGNVADTFDLALGAHVFPTTLDDSTVTVAAGESTAVHVTVHIPAGAAGNTHDAVQVTATSQAAPSQHDAATLTTYVSPLYGVELAAVDDTLSGQGGTTVMYTLIITNTGNVTDTFTLSASGNAPAWVVQLPVTNVVLGAGEAITVTVHVTIPSSAAVGDHDTVTITATGSGSATAQVHLTTTATAPALRRLFLPIVWKDVP